MKLGKHGNIGRIRVVGLILGLVFGIFSGVVIGGIVNVAISPFVSVAATWACNSANKLARAQGHGSQHKRQNQKAAYQNASLLHSKFLQNNFIFLRLQINLDKKMEKYGLG